jgi:hypothetical protein
MAELIEITRALEMVREFSPLERILLTCSGTLQGTLSAYFGREIKVSVTSQEMDANGIIRRNADLHDGKVVVCQASSQLTIQAPEIREQVLARDLGIGQVLETQGLRPSIELDQVGRNDLQFWRAYTLRAPGVTYVIKETFPQVLYPEGRPVYP